MTLGVSGERWECPLCGDKNPGTYTSCRCGAPALPVLADVYEPKLPWKQVDEESMAAGFNSHGWSPSKYHGHKAHTRPAALSKDGTLAEVEAQIRRDFVMITRFPKAVLEGPHNDKNKNDARRALHGLPASPSGVSMSKCSSSPALPSMPLYQPQPSISNVEQPGIVSYGSRKPLQINSQTHSGIPSRTHPVSLVSGGKVDPKCKSCEKLLGAVDGTMDAFVVLVEDVLSAANAGRASGGFTAETHARKGVQEILTYVAKEYDNIINLVDDGLEEAYMMVDDLSLKLKVPVTRRPPPVEIDLTPPAPEPGRRDNFVSNMKTEAQRAFDEYQWEWWTHDDKGKFTGLEPEEDSKMNWWTEEQSAQKKHGGSHGIHTFAQWNYYFEKDQPNLDAMDESLDLLGYFENNWIDKNQGKRGTAPWLSPAKVVFPDDWRSDEAMEEAFRKVNKRGTAPYLLPQSARSFEFETQRPKVMTQYEVRSGQWRTPEEVFGYREKEYDNYLKEEGYVSPDSDELDAEKSEVREKEQAQSQDLRIPRMSAIPGLASAPKASTLSLAKANPKAIPGVPANFDETSSQPVQTKSAGFKGMLRSAFAFGAFSSKKKAPETPEKQLPVMQRLESNLPNSGVQDDEGHDEDFGMSATASMASTGRRPSGSISPGARRVSVSKNTLGKNQKKPIKGLSALGKPKKKSALKDPEAFGRSRTTDLDKTERPSVSFKTTPSTPNLNQLRQYEAFGGEESTSSAAYQSRNLR